MSTHVLVAGPAAPAATPDTLTAACHSSDPGIACRLVWDVTHSTSAADLTKVYFAGPTQLVIRIGFVILVALALRLIAHRAIGRITARAARDAADGQDRTHTLLFRERRRQRAAALGAILSNAASLAIFGIAAVMILGDLGFNLAPVLASAGVLGVALGFGAQNLVQDFLAGIFMLLEDQYGVGDIVDIGGTSGTVEAVSLRITRLRDVNGVAWHIRNGTISKAGNKSQGWARAVVDFPVPYRHDIPQVRQVMARTATAMWQEPSWRGVILEQPECGASRRCTPTPCCCGSWPGPRHYGSGKSSGSSPNGSRTRSTRPTWATAPKAQPARRRRIPGVRAQRARGRGRR